MDKEARLKRKRKRTAHAERDKRKRKTTDIEPQDTDTDDDEEDSEDDEEPKEADDEEEEEDSEEEEGMASNSKRPRRNSNCPYEEALSRKSFHRYSHKIGKEWKQLLVRLGIRSAKIEQYNIDFIKTHKKIFHGLCEWNTRAILKTPVKRFAELCKALQHCQLQNVVDEIYSTYFSEQTSSSLAEMEYPQTEENNKSLEDIRIKVLKKSERQISYRGREEYLLYFNIIGGFINEKKEKELITIVSYDSDFDRIRVGNSYKFKDLIRKRDQLFVVTGSTTVRVRRLSEEFKCDMMLPEEEPEGGLPRSLLAALKTRKFSVINAKVFKKSAVKYVQDGTLAVRYLALFDKHGTAKMTLFGKLAEMEYNENKIIRVNYIFGRVYNGRAQLQASRKTEICDAPKSDLESLSPPTDAFDDDDDFKTTLDTFTIDGIVKAKMYDACSNPDCKKKKVNNVCPKCKGHKTVRTCRVVLLLLKCDGSETEVTLFEDNVFKLFKIREFESDDVLMEMMPNSFRATLCDGKLSNICGIDP